MDLKEELFQIEPKIDLIHELLGYGHFAEMTRDYGTGAFMGKEHGDIGFNAWLGHPSDIALRRTRDVIERLSPENKEIAIAKLKQFNLWPLIAKTGPGAPGAGFKVIGRSPSGEANLLQTGEGVIIERIAKGKQKGWWRIIVGETEYVGKTPESVLEIARSKGAIPKAMPVPAVGPIDDGDGKEDIELEQALVEARKWGVEHAETSIDAGIAVSYIDAIQKNRAQAKKMGLSSAEADRVQLLYILNNLQGWRGDEARWAKAIMKKKSTWRSPSTSPGAECATAIANVLTGLENLMHSQVVVPFAKFGEKTPPIFGTLPSQVHVEKDLEVSKTNFEAVTEIPQRIDDAYTQLIAQAHSGAYDHAAMDRDYSMILKWILDEVAPTVATTCDCKEV